MSRTGRFSPRTLNPSHIVHHGLHSPPEVLRDAGGGFPSPEVAMESVDQHQNHLALPALASLPAPMSLPALDVPPGSGAPGISGDADCCSCVGSTSISGGASQVTSLVYITLFARVSIRNESRSGRRPARGRSYSRTWGTTSTGGSSGNTPDEETGVVVQVLPCRTTSRAATCRPG